MPRYLIKWDGGCGESGLIIQAEDQEEAVNHAYELAQEEAENQMAYSAEEFDPDNEDHQEYEIE